MGAGLFVLSLGYFLFTYWTRFGRPIDGPLRPAALVWNVVLFSAFALHHSVFARESVRQRLTRAWPHHERSVYVWIASVLFIAVSKLWLPLGGTIWEVGGVARAVLLILHVGGIGLSVYSAALIDVWELAGIRQVNAQLPTSNSQPRPTSNCQTELEFTTTGPYGWVRHPIYLGWFFIVFCVGTMTMTRFVFAVVSCVYILLAIPFEERSIRRSSHGAYDRYMQKVPSKLMPGLY
jgi:protein-S-isoprenylcysteine O-methyltransferase Ste14